MKVSTAKGPLPQAKHDHIQGPIDAPIRLVEYGDYECPYCGHAYFIIKEVQERLGDRLCFAFRNFPLTDMHQHAEHAAETAEAAGTQGKFWEMHDMLFENQTALEDDDLAGYAEALSLDAHRLMEDVWAGANLVRIKEDFKSGVRGGVNGTPSLFINGSFYEGELDVDELLAALTKATRRATAGAAG